MRNCESPAEYSVWQGIAHIKTEFIGGGGGAGGALCACVRVNVLEVGKRGGLNLIALPVI